MNTSPTLRRFRLAILLLFCICVAVSCTSGCLRNRWADDGEGFRDHPALPRQNFGRPSEKRGQAGFDQRSRDIETSLGIEGSPPRFFER